MQVYRRLHTKSLEREIPSVFFSRVRTMIILYDGFISRYGRLSGGKLAALCPLAILLLSLTVQLSPRPHEAL
ncbi:MAG TPA: hypothetical protein DDZ51_13340 [Planctomycetaceae bacterium]|nr:hypothetical protein [Planctomycetaceae bacterium]